MELINTITGFLVKIFQWWFTVMPWEQALLIRRGKKGKTIGGRALLKNLVK